jgi:hypothetical protein
MNNPVAKLNQALDAVSGILGGWFLGIFIFICAFIIFMSVSNCIVYGNVVSNGGNADISKNFALALLILNAVLVLLALFGFFFVLLRWSKYKDMQKGIKAFTAESVIKATFDKGVNPAIEQRKNLPSKILNQDILKQSSYSSKELENLSYSLKPQFMPSNPESFMNKYD